MIGICGSAGSATVERGVVEITHFRKKAGPKSSAPKLLCEVGQRTNPSDELVQPRLSPQAAC